MSIPDKLRQAREAAGLTQQEAANKTGINKKSISNYECGVSSPDMDKLRLLCKAYGVSADEIIEVDLSDEGMRTLYRLYKKAPAHIQKAIDSMLSGQ